ncbi:MAG: hypothetical protein ACETVX_04150 [bacterium]|nr:hypothetical protein [candidate division WOR-3 bacterium]MDH5682950.1 hypothetical protein [candidate division WOR-3 bacterium]
MKCRLCNQRRSNRHCPALNTPICSLCCGTKRRRTISCPDNCSYLISGRVYQEHRIGNMEILKKARDLIPDYMNNIEHGILVIRNTRFRNLLDREVKEALENILKTIETAERKIIYEYRSTNPRIQTVADSVYQIIEKHQKGEDGMRRVTVEETKACLKAIIATIKSLLKQNPDSTTYLDLISQYSQGIIRETPPPITPGKLIQK